MPSLAGLFRARSQHKRVHQLFHRQRASQGSVTAQVGISPSGRLVGSGASVRIGKPPPSPAYCWAARRSVGPPAGGVAVRVGARVLGFGWGKRGGRHNPHQTGFPVGVAQRAFRLRQLAFGQRNRALAGFQAGKRSSISGPLPVLPGCASWVATRWKRPGSFSSTTCASWVKSCQTPNWRASAPAGRRSVRYQRRSGPPHR